MTQERIFSTTMGEFSGKDLAKVVRGIISDEDVLIGELYDKAGINLPDSTNLQPSIGEAAYFMAGEPVAQDIIIRQAGGAYHARLIESGFSRKEAYKQTKKFVTTMPDDPMARALKIQGMLELAKQNERERVTKRAEQNPEPSIFTEMQENSDIFLH